MLIPYDPDAWRLLTPSNVAFRQLWPWAHSLQKHVDRGEPKHRATRNLVVASDYGGEHHGASHFIYCYLFVRGGGSAYLRACAETRRQHLRDGRRMSYKGLNDRQRRDALNPYLRAAAELDGHLVAIAVDKRKRWLSIPAGKHEDLRAALDIPFRSRWNARALEAMLRKVHCIAALLPLWTVPYGNVSWITDHDAFLANDARHDDALAAFGRMCSFYLTYPMGVVRLNSTQQDPEACEFEEFCAIPDLAAGMLSDIVTGLGSERPWEERFNLTLRRPIAPKTELIADWFWDEATPLRKTLVCVDLAPEGRYGVRKFWMH
jgi:hypothetical protein